MASKDGIERWHRKIRWRRRSRREKFQLGSPLPPQVSAFQAMASLMPSRPSNAFKAFQWTNKHSAAHIKATSTKKKRSESYTVQENNSVDSGVVILKLVSNAPILEEECIQPGPVFCLVVGVLCCVGCFRLNSWIQFRASWGTGGAVNPRRNYRTWRRLPGEIVERVAIRGEKTERAGKSEARYWIVPAPAEAASRASPAKGGLFRVPLLWVWTISVRSGTSLICFIDGQLPTTKSNTCFALTGRKTWQRANTMENVLRSHAQRRHDRQDRLPK